MPLYGYFSTYDDNPNPLELRKLTERQARAHNEILRAQKIPAVWREIDGEVETVELPSKIKGIRILGIRIC